MLRSYQFASAFPFAVLFSSFIFSLAPMLCADEAASKLTLDRIYASGEFRAEGYAAKWFGDTSQYVRFEASEGPSGGRDLVSYDAKTGARKVLVSAEHLVPAKETKPLTIEGYSYSLDKSKLLIYTNSKRVWRRNTRGDYWILDRSSRELRQVASDKPASTLMFAKFSPNGRKVGYVHAGNIYVEDIATGATTQLTEKQNPEQINGTFDWVYEEEFGLRDGWRWSPDGKTIAFWQIDATGVRDFPLVNNTDSLYPTILNLKYPKVGETNSRCRIGVVWVRDELTKVVPDTHWLKISDDERNNYIARMNWMDDRTLILQHLNRLQNRNRVIAVDIFTERSRQVFVDEDKAWVEVFDGIQWLDGGKSFTWESERDGWRQLYVVQADGSGHRCVTPESFDVIEFLRADEKRKLFYFLASPENATQKYLYRIGFGEEKAERVTPADQDGTHSYELSADGSWAIHSYSSANRPAIKELISLPDHKTVRVFEDNSELRSRLAQLDTAPVEFFKVPIDDGTGDESVELDAWCIRPANFDKSKKYPLLVYVYGEPAGQTVLDRWGGSTYLWYQMLAQRGYFVVSIDNRGTPAPRGREWRKQVYRQIGILAPKDQAAAVRRILSDRPYLDADRVGVWGWSGGGSMSLNAIFKYPDIYRVAMSVAPVPNQRFYDTIYQERYMGLPSDNVEGFREGSPINFAHQLEGKLLVVHGTGDDNCHYQGVEALANELIRHNKQFSMMAYPNRSHSIREGVNTTLHLRNLLTGFLGTHLPAGARERLDASPDGGKHLTRQVEGWKVHVDRALLDGEFSELGAQALKILGNELYEVVMRVPADKLRKLREVPIWMDHKHALTSLQYHPGAGWLKNNGHDPRMVKCVHIPRAESLVNLHRTNHQPWVILHELSHAYHDRVLGFEDERILKAYERVKRAKIYEKVSINRGGRKTRHYALTNHKEFFAEMTESYFGTNDFYPFVRRELINYDPETEAMLQAVWGKVR